MDATTQAARVPNPYARMVPPTAQNVVNMGRQSQQRVSNQIKRKYKLCSSNNNNNNKRKKGDQLTLLGGVAFEAKKDCIVCKAQFLATFIDKRYFFTVESPNNKGRIKQRLP